MIHADVLGERARLTPDKTALVWVPTGERFTYRQLDDRAARTATCWLGVLGLTPGTESACWPTIGSSSSTRSSPRPNPASCSCRSAPA